MPFQEKRFDDLPQVLPGRDPDDPDVKIFFHGQLILRSPDGKSCDVAVNPLAADHVLSIEVRIKKEGAPDLIRMRHLGPLNFRDSEAMLIEVQGGPNPIVPAAYGLIGNDPINFADKTSAPDDDFRWILNIEGALFHDRALNPPGFASQNVIRLGHGEYYFKTAAHPDKRLEYVRRGGNKPETKFDTIGSVGSASVFLEKFQSLVMKWQDGTQAERTLILNQNNETRYEIYIENTPLFLDKPLEADLPRMDEFVHYYKVLDVPGAERFSVVPKIRPPDPDDAQFGTPEVPCQIIKQNGSGGAGGG